MTDTTHNEAHSQAQQLGSQNRAQNCSLNNLELIVLDQDHEHDHLNNRSESCLDQNSEHLMQFSSEFLASETNQIGTRDHGKIIENEYRKMEVGSRISDGNCCWHDGPEDIADSRCSARRKPANLEEFLHVYATSATLSSRLDTRGDATLCAFIWG